MNSWSVNCHNYALISLIFLLRTASELRGATYYVATTGDDSNSGTSTNAPWQTIVRAANTATNAGDTVFIKAGLYTNQNVVIKGSGTSSAPITFQGYQTYPGDTPTVNYNAGDLLDPSIMPLLDGTTRYSSEKRAIGIYSHDYITVKNMQIRQYNRGIFATNVNNCTFENIIATDMGNPTIESDGFGISVRGDANNKAKYNVVKGCIAANCCREGITVENGYFNTIENCQALCNVGSTVEEAMDYYITVKYGCVSNTIINCYADRIGNLLHFGWGIHLKNDCQYNLIKNCVAVNNVCANFGFRHSDVFNNTIEDCTAIGGTGLVARDGANNNIFRNCRTIGCNSGVLFTDTTEGGNPDLSSGNNTRFENCIFENTLDPCIWFRWLTNIPYKTPAFSNDFINCTFYGASALFQCELPSYSNRFINCIVTGVTNLYTGTNTLDYSATYSDFYNNGFGMPDGAGNFSSNPEFVSEENSDFRLHDESPCINAGTDVAVFMDHTWQSRPHNSYYDVGAHEYSASVLYITLDEAGGSAAADFMGNVSDGVVVNGAWITNGGYYGGALLFNGTNTSVNFCNPPELKEINNRLTISAWVKPEEINGYRAVAGKNIWIAGLYIYDGSLRGYMAGSDIDADSRSASGVITTGVWQHVAMTFDAAGDKKIRLYVNGVEVSSYTRQRPMSGTPITSSDDFSIGSTRGISYWFKGIVDEIKVFPRQLSGEEVYNQCYAVLNTGFNERKGNSVYDETFGLSGIVTGGVAWVTNGYNGSALYFNGTNASVNFGTPAPLNNLGSGLIITAWIKPEETNGYRTVVAKNIWKLSLGVDNGVLRGYVAGNTINADSKSVDKIQLGQWQQVKMTFDEKGDQKIRLYINSVEVGYTQQTALAGGLSTNTSIFTIGSSRHVSNWFCGLIDEVKVYR